MAELFALGLGNEPFRRCRRRPSKGWIYSGCWVTGALRSASSAACPKERRRRTARAESYSRGEPHSPAAREKPIRRASRVHMLYRIHHRSSPEPRNDKTCPNVVCEGIQGGSLQPPASVQRPRDTNLGVCCLPQRLSSAPGGSL